MPQRSWAWSQWSSLDLVHRARIFFFCIVNALVTSVHKPSWESTETKAGLMCVIWPSFLNMWCLTYFPHEITHASALLSLFIDGHFQLSDYGGKRYYVINTTTTSAKNPLGMQHINCQTQSILLDQKSTMYGPWPILVRVFKCLFMYALAIGCIQWRVTTKHSGYKSL